MKIAIFVLFSVLSWVTLNCSKCEKISFDCSICYDSCAASQNTTFINCNHTLDCKNYTYDYSTDPPQSTCIQYNYEMLKQQDCFPVCCKDNVYQFSADELTKCIKDYQKFNPLYLIPPGVFLCFLIFCFCFCVARRNASFACCSCSSCSSCCSSFGNCLIACLKCKCFRQNSDNPQFSQNNVQSQQNLTLLTLNNSQWQSLSGPHQRISDFNLSCPICLNNKSNALTKCNHCFHFQCILEWSKRNFHCPLCHRQQIEEIKFFCLKCCQNYVNLNLRANYNAEDVLRKLNTLHCPNCS